MSPAHTGSTTLPGWRMSYTLRKVWGQPQAAHNSQRIDIFACEWRSTSFAMLSNSYAFLQLQANNLSTAHTQRTCLAYSLYRVCHHSHKRWQVTLFAWLFFSLYLRQTPSKNIPILLEEIDISILDNDGIWRTAQPTQTHKRTTENIIVAFIIIIYYSIWNGKRKTKSDTNIRMCQPHTATPLRTYRERTERLNERKNVKRPIQFHLPYCVPMFSILYSNILLLLLLLLCFLALCNCMFPNGI